MESTHKRWYRPPRTKISARKWRWFCFFAPLYSRFLVNCALARSQDGLQLSTPAEVRRCGAPAGRNRRHSRERGPRAAITPAAARGPGPKKRNGSKARAAITPAAAWALDHQRGNALRSTHHFSSGPRWTQTEFLFLAESNTK